MSRGSRIRALCAAWLACAPLWVAAAESCSTPDALTPDGGRYCGALLDGSLHGRGVIEWSNGSRYEGEFARGVFSGAGKLRTAAGDTFEGEYRDGTLNGQGHARLRDGSIYRGAFRKDYFHGRGRLESPNGYVYEGAFEDGLYHGIGVLTGEGNRYEGAFVRGQYSGQGELVLANGDRYRGAFARSRYDGNGHLTQTNGDVYEGAFKDGQFVEGAYTQKDGSRYEGGFQQWRFHGKGRYIDARGNTYEGQFTKGDLNGAGRLTGKRRGSYEGDFRAWRFHGQGVLRLPNGDVYKGGFARGAYDGKGVLTYAAAKPDGRRQDSGTWRFGRLQDKAAEKKALEGLEQALYGQRRLLDAALDAVSMREPGRINLYLLAVAGDGSQEVFRREVDFVREQFARRFGTGARTLALINSRNTLTSAPMATRVSIRESLQRIAQRMDTQNDILFLFLTSHGSREHEFAINQNHLSLPGITAKELGGMLKDSGIRWKVVIVSACYSGGFVDAVKDDYTLVITAARHDRQSFGCADDSELTYFGRAYFKEALPQVQSFEDAFTHASKLVREWENKDSADEGKAGETQYSYPQMHRAEAIARQLRLWWQQQAGLSPP